MPRKQLPEGATPLWRWMNERRVTLEELALLVECTPQHLSDIRRGVRRPSDALKESILRATVEMERQRGYAKPTGVPISVWYEAVKA